MRVVKVRPGGKTPCVYVGRAFAGYAEGYFHNPHNIGRCRECGETHVRGEAVEAYRARLAGRILGGEPEVVRALLALPEDAALGCWCADIADPLAGPLVCHAQVVARAAAWLRQSPCPLCEGRGMRHLWDAMAGNYWAFCPCPAGAAEEKEQCERYAGA